MKAILFDLDGTLIDSSEGITKSAQYALAHYGIEETDLKKLYFFIGPPLSVTFQTHYGFSEKRRMKQCRYTENVTTKSAFSNAAFSWAWRHAFVS